MKRLMFPFVLSLGIHGLGVMQPGSFSFTQATSVSKNDQKELTHFSYTASELKSSQKQEAVVHPSVPAKKIITSTNDKIIQRMRRSVEKQIRQLKYEPPSDSAIRSSAEVLSDPKTKKVFTAYFTKIRQQIHHVAQAGSFEIPSGATRSATLEFVLAGDGSVVQIGSVLDQNSRTLSEADIFSQRCLKTAAPFDPFPKEILFKKIAFSITLIFEE